MKAKHRFAFNVVGDFKRSTRFNLIVENIQF